VCKGQLTINNQLFNSQDEEKKLSIIKCTIKWQANHKLWMKKNKQIIIKITNKLHGRFSKF
jgi:hypothetical protein